jgi:hypothetical protein
MVLSFEVVTTQPSFLLSQESMILLVILSSSEVLTVILPYRHSCESRNPSGKLALSANRMDSCFRRNDGEAGMTGGREVVEKLDRVPQAISLDIGGHS